MRHHFFDDWLIHAPSEWAHNVILEAVLSLIADVGMTLNFSKCVIGVKEEEFVGVKISNEGYQPLEDGIIAVQEFHQPANKNEVHSFFGLANYFAAYVPNFATLSHPLRALLKKNAVFQWGVPEESAFQNLKYAIVQAPVLGFFRSDVETLVIADASPVGLGGILAQIHDGKPRAIRYASHALSEVEQRYSQTEKEAYSLVYICEKFQFFSSGKTLSPADGPQSLDLQIWR